MTEERKKRIHLIYSIVTSLIIFVAGLCFILACINIYNSGDEPFSRSAIASAFSAIAIPVYLCLFLVLGGFLLNLCLPFEKKKLRAAKSPAQTLQKLHAQTNPDHYAPSLRISILAEQNKRKCHLLISTVLLVLCSTIFLCYALTPSHFDSVLINASVLQALWILIFCLTLPFAYILFTIYYVSRSMQREIDLIKQATAEALRSKEEMAEKVQYKQAKEAQQEKGFLILRYAVLFVGVVFLLYGLATGGVTDVLTKAVNICTECIGLG